jgi:hypothetical protein
MSGVSPPPTAPSAPWDSRYDMIVLSIESFLNFAPLTFLA